MISQTAEYALRAVVCLLPGDCHRTVEAIAGTAQIPVGYLAKIMLVLCRAGIVTSQRGIHGGFALKDGGAGLTMLDVIAAVDPIRRFHECPLGPGGHGTDLCQLHRFLDSLAAALENRLRSIPIASLADPRGAFRVAAAPEGGDVMTSGH